MVQAMVRCLHVGDHQGLRASLLAADSTNPGQDSLVDRVVNKMPEEAVVPLMEEIVKCLRVRE